MPKLTSKLVSLAHCTRKKRGPPFIWVSPLTLKISIASSAFYLFQAIYSLLLPNTTGLQNSFIIDRRLYRHDTLWTFTPLYPIYPTQFDIRQTGFDKIPLLLCGIQYRMISAERSEAFDRCGGICYNKSTKGNTADRRSVLKVSYKNSNRIPWLGAVTFLCGLCKQSGLTR